MSLPPERQQKHYFGLIRLIVELGVFSAAVFSLALFVAAIAQAYQTISHAMRHLGEEGTAKHLMIAAVEQADLLLVGMALLMMSFGMQALFVGRVHNVPDWLHIRSFDDLKQKLLGIVAVALAVNFFSVALEWKAGQDILIYGLALAAIILATSLYSLVLARQSRHDH
ncbi:YqhA family protein [Deinococcus lacus]|uniref:YqhA family protein n=1 Tax=Deinococcus lacus TaxID=392561 RepID=A0ABW1YEL6_9DEIO